uniref:Uncharacterized protein n=1 Tax=Arundo donax TaxID=35708 RepID=A0A0A9H963_ARUDO
MSSSLALLPPAAALTLATLNGGGTYGGAAHRSSAQLTPLKNGCRLMAAAPTVAPSRRAGSLARSAVTRSLAADDTEGSLGNSSARATMLASVTSLS